MIRKLTVRMESSRALTVGATPPPQNVSHGYSLSFAPIVGQTQLGKVAGHDVRLYLGTNQVAEFYMLRRGVLAVEEGFDSILIVPNSGEVAAPYTWLIGTDEGDWPPEIGIPGDDAGGEFLGEVREAGPLFTAPVAITVPADNSRHTVVPDQEYTPTAMGSTCTAIVQNNDPNNNLLAYNGVAPATSAGMQGVSYVVMSGGDIKNIPVDAENGLSLVSANTNAISAATISYSRP